MTKFHVTFGDRKKLVNIEDIKNLKFIIRKAFGVKNKFCLQRFIKEFDDWVDVDQPEDCLAGRDESFVKLKVVLFDHTCSVCILYCIHRMHPVDTMVYAWARRRRGV